MVKPAEKREGDFYNPLLVTPAEVRALLRKPELFDERAAYNAKVMLHGGGVGRSRRAGETTNEFEVRMRAEDSARLAQAIAEMHAKRAAAEPERQKLARKLHEVGDPPWKLEEMPNQGE